jgi:aminopeptidase N
MIDHPYDKATSEFIVTAPAKYQVVANGLLLETIDRGDGRRTTHWKQGVPIASWLNATGVEQFFVHHAGRVKGVELQTWVAHQDQAAGRVYFEGPARQALELYSEHVGPYAYEKLANVAAAGINGGTEHASAIFYASAASSRRPRSASWLTRSRISGSATRSPGAIGTDDFRRVMEQVSGTDLEWFFTQWLTRSGIPRLEGTWRFDAAARQVTVTLTQSNMAAPAGLPIEIGITTTAGTPPRIEKVELIDRTSTFTLAADTEPAAVTLDPNTWLLFEAGPFTKP